MKSVIFFLLVFTTYTTFAQWTWMGGANIGTNGGIYGTKGIFGPSNIPGGRRASAYWLGNDSCIYLFGGIGWPKASAPQLLGTLNDLWKYNKITNQWVWLKGEDTLFNSGFSGSIGIGNSLTNPRSRSGAAFFKDNQGDLWMFGGWTGRKVGIGYDYFNDLWKYEILQNRWTWINGNNYPNVNGVYGIMNVPAATNKLGSRYGSAFWTGNNNNFYIFGGYGFDANGNTNRLSDLWEYNRQSNYWTFIKGNTSAWNAGYYGNLQVEATTNNPGGRRNAVTWIDNNGNLYLFGGFGMGRPPRPSDGYLNDLWKYNITSKNWVWLNGDSLMDVTGKYGLKNTFSNNSKPGGREGASTWKDKDGNFWLFGGYGYSSTGVVAYLNDVWKYSITNNQWAWVSGDTIYNQYGIYGTLGIPDTLNMPGSRKGAMFIYDNSNSLFCFGGEGYNSNYGPQYCNDLWKISLSGITFPVQLLDFKIANVNKGDVQLQWKVTNEQNLKGYHLERKVDGENYVELSSIKAKGGSGDFIYYYTDLNSKPGILFYRLKIEDNDGSFKYSKTVNLKIQNQEQIQIIPNPGENLLNIKFTNSSREQVIIKISNLQGKVILQDYTTAINGDNYYSTSSKMLAPGAYLVSISGEINRTAIFIKK